MLVCIPDCEVTFLERKPAPEKAIGPRWMSRVGFLVSFLGLIFGLVCSGPANAAVDYTGEWTGTWTADGGLSGPLSASMTQQGSNLSGTIDVEGTVCGDFYDVQVSGTYYSFNDTMSLQSELVICPLDQSYNKYWIDGGPPSGNTLSGSYELYSGPLNELVLWERGSFNLTRVTYTITASAGTGGTISPSGTVSVNAGANQMFTITPNTGYSIQDVQVDGSSVGAVPSHTFTNVQSNHTITASFSVATYTISASAWPGGTVSPSGAVSVNHGENQSFNITPDSGYRILDVQVDGVSVGAVPTYSFTDVQTDYTLVASFELDGSTCEVLKSEGFEGGVMPPSGWTLIKTNPDENWVIDLIPHVGNYSASVSYDSMLRHQDEVLLTPVLPMASATLHFWSMGSLYWCRDDFDNCDLEIWIVVGSWDGGAGDDIFVGEADGDWPADFDWALTTFELTQLMPKKPVRIGFRYTGLDGALIVIDDIQICYERAFLGMPWVPLLLLDE